MDEKDRRPLVEAIKHVTGIDDFDYRRQPKLAPDGKTEVVPYIYVKLVGLPGLYVMWLGGDAFIYANLFDVEKRLYWLNRPGAEPEVHTEQRFISAPDPFAGGTP